jgi:very-short-patch-repair endonuclease
VVVLDQRPFRGTVAVASGFVTPAQLRGSAWRRLLPDVYVAATASLDHRLWCEAALVYAGDRTGPIAISGLSAAYLMGVDLRSLGDDRVDVTVPHHVRLRSQLLRVTCARLTAADLSIVTGLTSTTGNRTALDLARSLDRLDAIAAVDALTHRHLADLTALRSLMLSLPPLWGRQRIAGVLDQVNSDAESPMESRLRVVLLDGGLPRPVSQFEVRDRDGRLVARLDLAYPAKRVGIEYEGDHHRERTAFRRDIARVNALQQLAWTIVRATADDVRNPAKLLRLIRQLLA